MPDTATAPPENSTPQGDWEASAQPEAALAAPPQESAPTAPEPGQLNMGGGSPTDIGKASVAAYNPPAPVVITPQKRGGLLGVMDSVADALTGKTRPEIGTDQDGNKYVKSTSLTRGEQWEKIAGEALVGGLKGLAAGRGSGNLGAAGAAGVDEGAKLAQQQKQDEQNMSAEAREQNLEKANHQMLVMKQAEHAFTMTNLQTKATQEDIKFAEGQEDRYHAGGGKLVGHMPTYGDGNLAALLKTDPDVMKGLVQDGTIKVVPHYDPDGKANGIDVWRMPHDFNSDQATDQSFYTFDPVKNELVQHMASDEMTKGQQDGYNMAAFNAKADFNNKKALAAHQQAQTDEANANASKVPSEIQKNKADTAKANADAGEANAKALTEKEKQSQMNDPALIDGIGTGKIAVGRMVYLLARNPALAAAVQEKYPDFDTTKVDSYGAAHKKFTSGKASDQLVNAGTALKHLQELQGLNTLASHVPGTAANKDYNTLATTASNELAEFYGTTTIPGIEDQKEGLRGQLNRDSAITRAAKALGDRLDSMENEYRNAAPSASYEAQMPTIDKDAQEARAKLDPRYKDRKVQELQQKPAAALPVDHAQQAATAGVPAGATPGYLNGKLAGYTDASGWHPLGGK